MKYIIGAPCKTCGNTKRRPNHTCILCQRAHMREYYQRNKLDWKIREMARAWA